MSDDKFARHMEAVALRILPEFVGEPNRSLSSKTELRWGKNGSLSVDLIKGVWADHEDNTGGGVLDLLQAYKGYNKAEAVEWLQEQGFIENRERAAATGANGAHGKQQGKFAGFMDTWPIATYEYFDDKGKLAYEVLKFDKTAPRRYMQRRRHTDGSWIWGLRDGVYGKVKSGDWFKVKPDKHYQDEKHFEDAKWFLYRRDEVTKAVSDAKPVVLCYASDTEILTPSGWLAFPELSPGTPVAQYDLTTSGVSFVVPSAHQRFRFIGEMVNLKATWCDLLVTPDHRQPRALQLGRGITVPKVLPASQVRKGAKLPTAGFAAGGEEMAPERARLLAAWLADGVWEPRGFKVSWNLKKERKKRRLRMLLSALGIKWTEHSPPSTPGWTGFRVTKNDMGAILALGPGKVWPWAALGWNAEARAAALDELRHWDGDSNGKKRVRFFTAERQSADVVAGMAAITGWYANVRTDRRPGKNDSFVVNLNQRMWRQIQSTPGRLSYDGEVWCCTVPTGLLVVRRNGKVTISGNCEGEKDVETLREWGFVATTNQGGAKNWHPELNDDLRGAHVVICSDIDAAGNARTLMRGAELRNIAASVRVIDLALHWKDAPDKSDVTDWKEKSGGTAEKFAALVRKAPPWKPTPPKSRFGALEWSHLDDPGPELDFLVDGWLTEGERSVIGGPSRSGKSFLAIHAAMCVARGQDFFDRPVKRGGVVYQAGEGARGVKRRLKAYRTHFQVADDADVPFVFLGSKVDLYSRDGDTQALIDEIKAWALTMSHPLRLVVIDTLATATAGADENSGKDMGIVLSNIARIAEETGAHVALVHHMNADGKKLRGHTSIFGNVDQVITVTMDEQTRIRTAVLAKQKDDEDGLKITFSLGSVPLGFNERTQREITSCVVLSVDEKERLKKEEERQGFSVNPTERKIMMNLFAAADKFGKFVKDETEGPRAAIGKITVKWEYYRDIALERMPEIEDRKKAAEQVRKEFARAKDFLIKAGVLGVEHPVMWWAGKPIRGFTRTFSGNQGPQSSASPEEPPSPGEQDIIDYGDRLF